MRPDDSVAAGVRVKLDAVKDWGEVMAKVIAYAHRLLARRRRDRAEEIAQEAIAQLFDPARTHLAAETQHEIEMVLCGLVKGLVSNDRRRKHHQHEVQVRESHRDNVGDGRASPEDLLAEQQERALAISQLRARVANDEVGVQLVELFASGVDEAQAQSDASGAPIETIRNARKRVFRHADAIAREREEQEEVA
jgi:hypothetical protein